MKILVVEDDLATVQALQSLLSSCNYAVDIATDGESGLHLANTCNYDLALLDMMLPRLDGVSLCQQLRKQGFQSPILLLTEQGEERTAIALYAGADDYVVKPVDEEELVARVQALLHRDGATQPTPQHELQQNQTLTAAQQTLEQEHQHYQHLFEFAPDAYLVTDPCGVIQQANHAASKLLCSPAQQLLGQPLEAFVAEGDRPNFCTCLKQFNFNQDWEVTIQPSTGVSFPALLAVTQIQNSQGQITGLHWSLRNIRSRKDVERQLQLARDEMELRVVERTVELMAAIQSLQQREAFLSSIYDGADQGVFVIEVADNNFYYSGFNHLAEQMAGSTTEELRGKTPEEAFGPTIGAGFRQNYQRCLQESKSISYEEYLVFENHTIWTLTTLSPLRNDQGHIYRIVGTAINITDRKQAELALQQQIRQEYLLADIAQDIRQSLNLGNVLSRTVHRVREYLKTDRVIIYRFRPDWQGDVIMESVAPGWASVLSTTIYDPCFSDRYIEPYRQGRIASVTNVDTEVLEPCYVELLKAFQVKANLVLPLLQGEHLWGLLIAHHCETPRQWQPAEIAMLKRLATQVSIAIQQSELYEQIRQELSTREQMQRVLEDSEERFRSLSSAAPIGILQTNADGICLYVNARWKEMSGYNLEVCLGNGWMQAIHPEDRTAFYQAWENCLHNGSGELPEFRLLTPRRETRWVTARVSAMQSATGEIMGYVCTSEDITERKLTEQKIRQQAALLDIASDAISVRDLTNRILYWNHGAERLYGWAATEVIGHEANQILQPRGIPIEDAMKQLLQQGEWRGEVHKVTKSHKPVIVEARWTLVKDETGQPQCILVVDTDVTEKKQLEAQFYQAQRLESLGVLASGLAHDLNNIFTPILAIAYMLRLQQKSLDAKAHDQLRLIEESAKRGTSMVKQVLTLTRSSNGEKTTVNLTGVLWEVINIVQGSFPKSIEVCPNIPDPERSEHALHSVLADSTQLTQVFMNLCVNARDAMPEGGALTITAENVFVDEAIAHTNLDAQVGTYVRVTVADTGTGIAPDVCDRMFDPFFTTKEAGRGTGLGLAMVLRIVKNYGGFLQVHTALGQGTEMKVYLPAMAVPFVEQSQVEQPSEDQWFGQGELVLIVDDDVSVQQTTQALLENCGYTTLVAGNGAEAIAIYQQRQKDIHLVALDITMPKMNGIELIQHLKRINSNVKIIAISGLPANQKPSLEAGATFFLSKPYSLETLLCSIHQLIYPNIHS